MCRRHRGDGRGGPGSSRVAVGGPSGRLPVLPGCAASVGVGTAAWGARDRRGAAAAAGPLRAVPGHACAAAGDGVAAAGVRGRGDRRGAAGSGCGEGSPLDRGGAEGSGGDGAGLATGDGRPTGPRSGASAAGGPPGRCRHHRAGGLRLSVARSAGRVGCGDCGADRPVRSGRGARPGDGVAGRRGVPATTSERRSNATEPSPHDNSTQVKDQAEIDTFISEVSTTSTNIAAANSRPSIR